MLLAVPASTLEACAIQPAALTTGTLSAGTLPGAAAAFGVLGGFQITNFDCFFVVSHISYPCCFGLLVCVVSVAPNNN